MAEQEERKLTKKEQIRKEKIDKLLEEKKSEGYKVNELTMGVVYANIMAIVSTAPILILFIVLFVLAYINADPKPELNVIGMMLLCVAFVIAVVVHELIHGLCWGLGASKRFKSIEFGVIWNMLTPYCTCLEPLTKAQYIIGSAMPGIVLGIIPMVISLFTLDASLLCFGLMLTMGAGGDLMVIIKILRYKSKGKETIFLDHPYKIGLMVLEKEE